VRRKASHLSKLFIVCVAMGALAVSLSACGDEESAQTLTFELAGKGQAAKFTGPESADPGEVELTFTNSTGEEAELQLIRVEDNRSAEDVIEGLEKATKGQAFPDWFFASGGVGSTPPGDSKTVTQVLEPGTYYTANVEAGAPDAESMVAIEVGGDESDEELEADATVTASEYTFDTEGLEAGENEVLFENVGAQPHHLIAAPITRGGTIAEVKKAIMGKGGGEPPLDEKAPQVTTAVIEGGESQVLDLDLEPGSYALLCFITDRQGGPPHAVKGMIEELTIE
jgi:hypothetical protein